MIIAIPYPCIGQEYYERGGYRLIRSHYDNALVDGVNVEALSERYLPDFRLTFRLAIWYNDVLYAFNRQTDQQSISICVGVYLSVQEAENAALDGLADRSERLTAGPVRGEQIGDNCWYSEMSYGNEKRLETIAFVKKNVFIVISAHNNEFSPLLLDLGKSIDHDIMNGSSCLTLADAPKPPVVNSIQVSINELRDGDTATITVSAADPEGKRIEYHQSSGINKLDIDPENVFRIQVSEDSIVRKFLGTTQTFEIWVVNEDNFFSQKKQFQVTFISPSSVSDKDADADAPSVFTLSQNTPNPFNPSTAIAFTLSRPGRVNLTVYDTLGREVAPLAAGNYSAGSHTVRWDGRDGRGNVVSSGVYLYRLESGGRTETRKMLLAR